MKKQYICPVNEMVRCAGTAVMLGASGDIHSSGTTEASQSTNRAPKLTPVFSD